MVRERAKRGAILALAPIGVLWAGAAGAQAPASAPVPAPGVSSAQAEASLPRDLELMLRLAERARAPRCSERCYFLDRLHLSGTLGSSARHEVSFELSGGVLVDHAVAVPLFGPPTSVRLTGALEDGKPAAVGFEGKHYFVHTAARRFTLRGALSVPSDDGLLVAGPLNTLTAQLTGGRLVEGNELSGLSSTTLHFSAGDAPKADFSTVSFSVARAFRVTKTVAFEYRLQMRSGSDLGVVKVPLPMGERVLEVSGAAGWSQDGATLVLPSLGKAAQVVISGTMPSLGEIVPDERAPFEHWLVESDTEHRVHVLGGAKQVDVAESQLTRTLPSARLFMVTRGARVKAQVEALQSVEALAAVVRRHDRHAVITPAGQMVVDDQLTYENNGVDYVPMGVDGDPVYLGTDGEGQRIVRRSGNPRELMLPLKQGSHRVRVQSVDFRALGPIAGATTLFWPTYDLTASKLHLSVGVPAHVHPVALIGGDHPWLCVGETDLVAAAAAGVASLSLPGLASRALGFVLLAGLWLASPPLFVLALLSLAVWALYRLTSRLFEGGARTVVQVVLGLGGALVALVLLLGAATMRGSAPSSDVRVGSATSAREGKASPEKGVDGLIDGVSAVPLDMPSAAHTVSAGRELSSRRQAFSARLYYVTDVGLAPLLLIWLGALVALLRRHRDEVSALTRRLSSLFAKRGEQGPA